MNETNECAEEHDLAKARAMVEKAERIARLEHWRKHDEKMAVQALLRALDDHLPAMIEAAVRAVVESRARETLSQTTQTA